MKKRFGWKEYLIMEDRCVCCGRAVPEGRMVCPECEIEAEEILDTFIEEV